MISRQAIRNVVRDITKLIKTRELGFYYLPGDSGEEYYFKNLGFSFSVEVNLTFDDTIKQDFIDGSFYHDDDVVEIILVLNPTNLNRNLYNLIGQLNEVIAHELTHGKQKSRGIPYVKDNSENSIDYYTKPIEVEAQINGFKRLSKISGVTYPKVVSKWFELNQHKHNMTLCDTIKVIKILN